MTGTLTAGVGVTASLPPAPDKTAEYDQGTNQMSVSDVVRQVSERLSHALHPVSHQVLGAVAPHIPDTYTVQAGDTVSSIADAYGLPTAAVLGLNGLTVNSLLHEGQIIKLTTAPTKQRAEAPPRVGLSQYVIQAGDTMSSIASRFGISQTALIEANDIDDSTVLLAGDVIRIPGTRTVTAPRAIPAIDQAQSQPRVVWASFDGESQTSSPSSSPLQPAAVDTASDSEGAADDDSAEATSADPLDIEIAEAPELRVVKKATPPPPPPPPQEPAQRAADRPAQQSGSGSSSNSASPAPAPAPAPSPRPSVSGTVVKLPHESQREHARTIIRVGRDLGISDFGIVIALATAMQESSFRNIQTAVDHDSLGLFQQRPYWWGTPEQLIDPVYATTVFFTGVQMPGVGFSRGLLGVSGWQDLPLTVAAQRVQRSAHPDAYARWEASAWSWLDELG